MQLEFFGETFDRAKCNNTCDNCRAGRQPDRRDMTNVAKSLLDLLADMSAQRNGRGVTMLQLTEIFRGSKSQSATKFLNTSKLKGYGAGSKLKKNEIERILHAMIFERILEETSVENNGGFSSDYVQPGEMSNSLQTGGRPLLVEFPKVTSLGKENKQNSPKKIKKSSASKPKKRTKKLLQPTSVAAESRPSQNEGEGGLQFIEVGDSSGDEDEADLSFASAGKQVMPSVLPSKYTKALEQKIKSLTQIWAEEERLLGNQTFCK